MILEAIRRSRKLSYQVKEERLMHTLTLNLSLVFAPELVAFTAPLLAFICDASASQINANSQQPTANSQQPTANSQQPLNHNTFYINTS